MEANAASPLEKGLTLRTKVGSRDSDQAERVQQLPHSVLIRRRCDFFALGTIEN